ncbi:MAG: alpha/beta fold hydrolase [Gammaproteobacteria bacterium]|nr:alpha/beta fold hydrolase [Gammaproteobacteria bacterium]
MNANAELPRAMMEAGLLSLTWPSLLARAQRGSGQPVVVVPGFLGGDDSTLALRRFLTRIGYPAQPWLLGRNHGRPEAVDKLARRFYRLYQVYKKPIVLIGQSLGGVYARELARQLPDAVAAVITLGSPFGARDSEDTNPMVARLFETMSGLSVEEMRARAKDDDPTEAPPMPCTSIFSKSDGVVSWQSCLQAESELAENIEIVGSHTGMAMHPLALHVIADRLAQPTNSWQKFDATLVLGVKTVKA